MRYVAAYLLAVLGGKASPSAGDIEKILSSVGIEADAEKLKKVIGELNGKDIEELMTKGKRICLFNMTCNFHDDFHYIPSFVGLISGDIFDADDDYLFGIIVVFYCDINCRLFAGREKLSSMPSGGGAAPAAAAAGAGAPAEAKKGWLRQIRAHILSRLKLDDEFF